MDGFKAYKYYMAVKLHFTRDNFNVFKNRGVVKGTRDTFNTRNDRYIFEKLARKFPSDQEIIQYFVANFAYGSSDVVYANEAAEARYFEWQKRKQAITQVFSEDCHKIVAAAQKDKISEETIFHFTPNTYPSILKLYLGGFIGVETMRILDDKLGMIEEWRQNSMAKTVWDADLRRIEKTKGFVKYDDERISKVYNVFMEEIAEL